MVKKSPFPFLAFALLTMVISCTTREEPADMLILGKIYTVNPAKPVVEAVAVSGERIIYAGPADSAAKYKGENTQVIELGNRIMTPGFIDGHAHLLGVGYNELNLNLADIRNYDELVDRVRMAVQKAKPGEWIIGRGWHQDKWDEKPETIVKGFQTHHLLSKVSPDNPVYLSHASGHAAMANLKAMETAGVTLMTAEKLNRDIPEEGGEIIRDEVGNPTGIFVERAMSLISRHIPENDPATREKALNLALAACLRNGLTGFHDAGATRESIELFYKFRKEGKLSVRLNVMLHGGDRALLEEWYERGPDIDPTYRLTIRSIKLYSDGALGSRGAWLLEPYSDRLETNGMAVISMDTVLKTAHEGLKYGFQVCTHAIGDRANREILNRYESAFMANPEKAKDHRFRIEHAQHIDPADIPRFGKLGVIPAMQAIHMSSDRPWAIERLGQKRIEQGAYMWQSLLKTGARVVNGTDAPVEPLDPIACFFASVTRKTLKGQPPGGYEPAEKMTREQALKSYTLDPAYAEFAEDAKGSIETGKLADFTIFSRDLMTVAEEEILETQVEMTISGGKVVYQKK
jgi:predicted amidohydrolase YtcJ